MANEAAAKLDPDRWQKLWQIFQQSGIVTASTAFVARMRAEGFERAAQDFLQCLGQLNLIAPSIPE